MLITGATGLIGTELTRSLRSKDITVRRLTTGTKKGDFDYSWNPSTNSIGNTDRMNCKLCCKLFCNPYIFSKSLDSYL